jgi:arsenate reductase-like glutaredoxin family protein
MDIFRRHRAKAYRALNRDDTATKDEAEAEKLLSKP